jgi:hypothetical protein
VELWFYWGLWAAFYGWLFMPQLVGVNCVNDPSEKAMRLLWSWLTAAQRDSFTRHGYFYVKGNVTGRTYRINKAVAPFNVEEIGRGGVVRRLCFVPAGTNFAGDIMLAQKVGLEKDEATVLSVANDYDNWPGRNIETISVGRMGQAGIERLA